MENIKVTLIIDQKDPKTGQILPAGFPGICKEVTPGGDAIVDFGRLGKWRITKYKLRQLEDEN